MDCQREKRRGFLAATDLKTHELVMAEDAEEGVGKYGCPYCGTPMFKTHRYDKVFFRRENNAHHHKKICGEIEEKGRMCSLRKSASPDKLFEKIMHVARTSRNNTGRKSSSADDESASKNYPIDDENDIIVRTIEFSSLRQIKKYKIYMENPNMKIGKYLLKDFILTYKSGLEIFKDEDFVLGGRILHAKAIAYNNEEKMILFHIFIQKEFVAFAVKFINMKDYKDRRDMLFVQIPNNETGKYELEKKEALICSDKWEELCTNEELRCVLGRNSSYYLNNDKCIRIYLMEAPKKSVVERID